MYKCTFTRQYLVITLAQICYRVKKCIIIVNFFLNYKHVF